MANSKRKCKWCGIYHLTDSGVKVPAGSFCSIDHAVEYASDKRAKDSAKIKAKTKQVVAQKEKAARSALRKRKEAVKPKSKWLSELQALVNQYVRLRDASEGCISCDKPFNWGGQYHAGHYFSRGHSSALRFNLSNLHKQCSVCNNHLSGNIGEYTPRLIEKIGIDKFEWLCDHKSDVKTFDVEWIKRAIKITRKAIKRIK